MEIFFYCLQARRVKTQNNNRCRMVIKNIFKFSSLCLFFFLHHLHYLHFDKLLEGISQKTTFWKPVTAAGEKNFIGFVWKIVWRIFFFCSSCFLLLFPLPIFFFFYDAKQKIIAISSSKLIHHSINETFYSNREFSRSAPLQTVSDKS